DQGNMLLRLLYRTWRAREGDPVGRDEVQNDGKVWCWWRPGGGSGPPEYSRSDAASVSRTLRRLGQRGLVECINSVSAAARRTTDVALTPEGMAVAEKLATENWGKHWKKNG